MLYAHLHFYLMRLWRILATDDAMSADGLGPWLVVDYAQHVRGRRDGFPLQWLANMVVFILFILIFFATPIVLLCFWWWSMPKHDVWLTALFCGGAAYSVHMGRGEKPVGAVPWDRSQGGSVHIVDHLPLPRHRIRVDIVHRF